jgi:hypothetical protein
MITLERLALAFERQSAFPALKEQMALLDVMPAIGSNPATFLVDHPVLWLPDDGNNKAEIWK